MWLILLAAAHAAPCPSTTASLTASLDRAEAAFASLDDATFAASVNELERQIPCASETIPRATVARVHRTLGLSAWTAGDPEAARAAFAAAREIDPGYAFPEAVVPPGNPIAVAYAQPGVTGATSPVPTPATGRLLIDGSEGTVRPTARPAVVQRLDERLVPVESAYLRPGTAWLSYPVLVGTVDPIGPESPKVPERTPLPDGPQPRAGGMVATSFLAGGAGGLVVGGALYGAAWSARKTFDTATDEQTVRESYNRTNDLGRASLIAGGAGAVLLGTGVALKVAF